MRWNLERVLFWIAAIAAAFVTLSVLNYFLRFANPVQPEDRVLIGLTVDTFRFMFSMLAYFFVRIKRLKVALAVIALWVIASLLYAGLVLAFESLSLATVIIALGQLFICCVLLFYSLAEARSNGLLRDA